MLVLTAAAFHCPAGQTNSVKTNFIADAQLTKIELEQVLSLARRAGIHDAGEVATFQMLPGGGKGISVTSKERVEGRDIFFDYVCIYKIGWTDIETNKDAVWIGKFWSDSAKVTAHVRLYQLSKKAVRVDIGDNVDVKIADQAIPLIVAGKVRLKDKNDIAHLYFDEIKNAEPSAIYRSGEEYELRFTSISIIVGFRMEKGEVLITSVGFYSI